ncbi:hypothetical protein A8C56_20035 [Niabella ginsenosidivorans]|uniref:YtxH domain-containing protein n=1 Tax=Niabella ginsenosidivorans TaxID=1176587 RepID=A0A1A9I938_9BACT|nr:hypothetical protein [Niabella ginsenosidivorans]ANH84083.1 hypothetical protein A8C56_20035 [Niabella ginsenosidivorans]
MNKNTRNGLFALGLAAVAAWYKMSPDQKANLKNKVAGLGNKLKDNLNNLKGQVKQGNSTQSAS